MLPLIEAALEGGASLASGEDPNWSKQLRNIPMIGPILYNWFGPGAENYNKQLETEPLIFNLRTKRFNEDADRGGKINPLTKLLYNK